MNSKNINRREFLKLAGMTVAAGSMGGLLAGCVPPAAPAAPAAPQVVKETVVVEKAVEKAVTAGLHGERHPHALE